MDTLRRDRSDRDRIGGWRGKRYRATGFFRTEHDGKRWWLVTPEGNAFLTDAPMLTDPPAGPIVPYVRRYEPIILSHYRKPTPDAYVDIFAPAFETQCDVAAREMAAPYAADPMVLGYCMADCPILTDSDAKWSGGTTWPRVLRNLGAEAPGKQAYVATMRERYTDVAAFNRNYAAFRSSMGTRPTLFRTT